MGGNFQKVCRSEELRDGYCQVFRINDLSICLAMDGETVYAFDNICTHDGGILGEGKIEDHQIECPRHGAKFDIRTGEATQMPAVVRINTHEVKIKNEWVFIELTE